MVCRVGFLGSGNIVKAICKGLFKSGKFKPNEICMSGANNKDLEWAKELGSETYLNNGEILKNSDIIVLAVKPNIVPKVLNELNKEFTSKHLMFSVAAGIKLYDLEKMAQNVRLGRIMTSTAVETSNGASVYTLGKRCDINDGKKIESILSCLGYTKKIDENYFDVVSALVGSGPSFLYGVIEAMADGAVLCGLGRKEALELASYTMAGTGLLSIQSIDNNHPAELRDFVCSPGGSSIEGVYALEKGAYRHAFMSAIIAAYEKNKILGSSNFDDLNKK